ncbi:MAG TPA: FHA domain-containing protein [Polyangia bacterium]|nr:FHA domain-containing protein [Polyangia bacterium]
MSDDFVTRAAERPQAEFASAFPFPFLVGAAIDRPVTGPTQTLRGDAAATLAALRKQAAVDRLTNPKPPETRMVLAIRKIQGSFPSMITVGRTKNNDVVIADPLVSKFHAYFRLLGGVWLLADAGSANGTRIGDIELPKRGQPQPIQWGERVTFGDCMLTFLDPAGAWIALRARR